MPDDLARLRPAAAVHETLAPVYETVRLVRAALPREVPLIGFAGAPWTVATYMVAGRGTPDQAPARALLYREPALFDALIERITEATVAYLGAQVAAGAEVVKLFDSWAGSLPGPLFARYAVEPARRIAAAVRAAHPGVPVIGFPRGAGGGYAGFAREAGVQAVALDTAVDPAWATAALPAGMCLQGNLDPLLMVVGGEALAAAARATVEALRGAAARLQPRARDHAGRDAGERRDAAAGDPGLTLVDGAGLRPRLARRRTATRSRRRR